MFVFIAAHNAVPYTAWRTNTHMHEGPLSGQTHEDPADRVCLRRLRRNEVWGGEVPPQLLANHRVLGAPKTAADGNISEQFINYL